VSSIYALIVTQFITGRRKRRRVSRQGAILQALLRHGDLRIIRRKLRLTVAPGAFLSPLWSFRRGCPATCGEQSMAGDEPRSRSHSFSFSSAMRPLRSLNRIIIAESTRRRRLFVSVFARRRRLSNAPLSGLDTVYPCNAPHCVLTQQSTLPMCTVAYTSA